jgi:MFS family permease
MLIHTTDSSRDTVSRRTLSPRIAYALAAALVGLALFASGVPSPLYGIYRQLWDFSPLVLTLVYATYAFGVLTTLILAGRLSDEVGRRPVLLGALGVLMVATVLFILAHSLVWLFVARALQGLATGTMLSAASAALLELHPRRDTASVSLANGVASTTGTGLGVLVSAALVQLLPAPRVLPFVALLGLFAIAFVGVWWMPEPVATRTRARLTPQRPHVPRTMRGPFMLAALGALSSWSIAGLFLSLGPELSADLFHSTNHLVTGIGIFALTGSAAVAQLLRGRTAPWAAAAGGSLALAAGMVLLVVAAQTNSGVVYLAGALIGGAGFGVAFLGALRALTSVIPPENRAAVMSAFYIVAYAALSLPAIAGGILVSSAGILATFALFGTIAAALALVVALLAWRTRPRPSARVRRRRELLERLDLESEGLDEAAARDGAVKHGERPAVAVELRLGLRGVEPRVDQAAQLADLRDLVGCVHGGREAAGAAHPLAHIVLTLLLVLDRRVVADERDEIRDLGPEARFELRALGIGVLEDVVEHRGGDDVVRVTAALEQRGDLDRVQNELGAVGVAALPGMPLAREVHRVAGERQVPEETELGAVRVRVGHRRRVWMPRRGGM